MTRSERDMWLVIGFLVLLTIGLGYGVFSGKGQ